MPDFGCTPSTVRQGFVAAARAFRQAGLATPELDARLLACHATGLTHEDFVGGDDLALPTGAASRLEGFIARRLAGEPVSRLTGAREFYGRPFHLDRHTLDPRADTETLIEALLALVDENGWRGRPLKLLDLGTGSGCILVTLLAELPLATGFGSDVSAGALAVAAANACRHGVEARARFVAADWLDGIGGRFDLIVSNPPYIAAGEIAGLAPEVARFDPKLALDGGSDGLDSYRRIAAGAADALRPGGGLVVEIGAGQAEAVLGLLCAVGLEAREDRIRHDLAGLPRAVVARRAVEPHKVARPKKGLETPGVQVRFVPAE